MKKTEFKLNKTTTVMTLLTLFSYYSNLALACLPGTYPMKFVGTTFTDVKISPGFLTVDGQSFSVRFKDDDTVDFTHENDSSDEKETTNKVAGHPPSRVLIKSNDKKIGVVSLSFSSEGSATVSFCSWEGSNDLTTAPSAAKICVTML